VTAAGAVRMTVDAKAHQLAERVEVVAWKDGAGVVYAVPSLTTDDFYVVSDLTRLGIGHGLKCDCPAGAHNQACSHRTAVVLRRQREAERKGSGR
jgi:uncharacterized Zn finger protein